MGIDPKVLRSHPVFRVIKGMVMLTYPLKDSPVCFTNMEPAHIAQANPVTSQFYPVLEETEKVRIKYIVVQHGYTEARKINVKVTLDGVVWELAAGVDVTEDENWYVTRNHQATSQEYIAISATEAMFDTYEGVEALLAEVELCTKETIDGGDSMYCTVFYEKLV